MLTELHIENIAVIEKLTVSFDNGFSVLSGETGAGKSIIIDAINMVLGQRTSRELIRTGESTSYVSALFRDIDDNVIAALSDMGFENDGRNLMISREISVDGRSSARIDGRPVTAAVLREIGRMLVNIHGQNDSQSLMLPEKHFEYVDAYGDCGRCLESYREIYYQIKSLRDEMRELQMNETEKQRKTELLRYQIAEISAAGLVPDEEDKLLEKKNVIKNGAKLSDAVNRAYSLITNDDGNDAVTYLSKAFSDISSVSSSSQRLDKIASVLAEANDALRDAECELADFISEMDFDEGELERLEERLDIIYRLKKKYGNSVAEIIEYGEECEAELERITFSDERILQLKQEYDKLLEKLKSAANELSQKRRTASEKLSKGIVEQLAFLNIPDAKFEVESTPCKFNVNGGETLEFYISANRGEEPKPLCKIASGGELSRIMLAIKSVFADSDRICTMIFDEIDAGVSGSAADKIGRKLHDISAGCQVICITHLPQIASKADNQYLIYKNVENDKTYTRVSRLSPDERVTEIARMISCDSITDTARKTAYEMINNETER